MSAGRQAKRSLRVIVVSKPFEDLARGSSLMATAWRPPTDVFECGESYVIRMAISGLRHGPDGNIQNAQVTVEGNTLTISGFRHEHCTHEKHRFFQMEIHYGYFESHVRVDAPFDRAHIRAQYGDGFLEIIIPKAQEDTPGTHTITVEY